MLSKRTTFFSALTFLIATVLSFNIVAQAPTTKEDTGPSWSPDGSRIGFSSNRSGNFEIYTMNIQGGDVRKVTNDPAQDHYPVWSPSGKQIAFQSDRNGDNDIYAMNADGTEVTNLTRHPSNDEGYVSWSGDGKTIVFTSDRDGSPAVYSMAADGSNVRRLTNSKVWDVQPAFTSDGRNIVFTAMDPVKHVTDICIMDLDGKNRRVLQPNGSLPRPSLKGNLIVFQTDRDGKKIQGRVPAGELYVMNADGSAPRNVSSNDFWDFYCFFSPDAKQIVFTSIREDQNQEIFVMNSDGSHVRRLTFN